MAARGPCSVCRSRADLRGARQCIGPGKPEHSAASGDCRRCAGRLRPHHEHSSERLQARELWPHRPDGTRSTPAPGSRGRLRGRDGPREQVGVRNHELRCVEPTKGKPEMKSCKTFLWAAAGVALITGAGSAARAGTTTGIIPKAVTIAFLSSVRRGADDGGERAWRHGALNGRSAPSGPEQSRSSISSPTRRLGHRHRRGHPNAVAPELVAQFRTALRSSTPTDSDVARNARQVSASPIRPTPRRPHAGEEVRRADDELRRRVRDPLDDANDDEPGHLDQNHERELAKPEYAPSNSSRRRTARAKCRKPRWPPLVAQGVPCPEGHSRARRAGRRGRRAGDREGGQSG